MPKLLSKVRQGGQENSLSKNNGRSFRFFAKSPSEGNGESPQERSPAERQAFILRKYDGATHQSPDDSQRRTQQMALNAVGRDGFQHHDMKPVHHGKQVPYGEPVLRDINPVVAVDQTPALPKAPENLWVRAEQMLRKDNITNDILQAFLGILETELGSDRKPIGTTDRHEQLCGLFDTKVQQLEDGKWKVRVGDYQVVVRERLTRAFKNILSAKDLIHAAGTGFPPGAMLCAGVSAILTLLVQADDQHTHLLKGVDSIAGIICRLTVTEQLYRSEAELPNFDPKISVSFKHHFEERLAALYSKILEFEARALCYLHKHTVTRTFRDAFRQDGWDSLIQDIERLDHSVSTFSQLINANEVRTKLNQLQDAQDTNWKRQESLVRDERAKKFLRALYTCPYRDRKDRNGERVPGTCEWFTNHSHFQNWNTGAGPNILWVSADPGCGKSVLSKHLVDTVLPSTSNRTSCYFFFKDDFEDQKTATNAICGLLRQIFLAKPHLLRDSILDKFDIDGEAFTRSVRDLWDTLMDVAADPGVGEIVCIIDALDECPDPDRSWLIRAVADLYVPESKNHGLKFLLTSRPYDMIRRMFRWDLLENLPTIHLSGEAEVEIEKISREIDLVIQKRVQDISRQRGLEQVEREFLQAQLTSLPNKTYLWVTLTLNVIENMSGFTKGNVLRTIGQMPRTVKEAYSSILERSTDRVKAKRLLHFVVGAVRPLTLEEMAMAVAIRETHTTVADLEQELEPLGRFRDTLRDLCGLFVVIVDEKVYLLHQTVREFLVDDFVSHPREIPGWKSSLHPTESHRLLAEVCVWYLQLDTDETDPWNILRYPAEYWDAHVRKANLESHEPVIKRVRSICEPRTPKYELWSLARNASGVRDAVNCLQVAVCLGLVALAKLVLRCDGKADIETEGGQLGRPLQNAAESGNYAMVKLLLEHGAKLESRRYGETALTLAIIHGRDDVVNLLLEHGADIHCSSPSHTPLQAAASSGHEGFVKLLLDRGADMEDAGNSSWTPLLHAAMRGKVGTVKLLLDHGADMRDGRNGYESALILAARSGHEAAVELLLKRGTNIECHGWERETALAQAARNGHDAAVKLLVGHGANIEARSEHNATPLILASERGNRQMVKLLLKLGADINAANNYRHTALSTAAKKGHRDVVKVLLDYGADPAASASSPMSLAARYGQVEVVKLLQRHPRYTEPYGPPYIPGSGWCTPPPKGDSEPCYLFIPSEGYTRCSTPPLTSDPVPQQTSTVDEPEVDNLFWQPPPLEGGHQHKHWNPYSDSDNEEYTPFPVPGSVNDWDRDDLPILPPHKGDDPNRWRIDPSTAPTSEGTYRWKT